MRRHLTGSALGLAFLAAAVPLALLLPSEREPSLFLVAALVATYVVALRVHFEVSFGSAVPTQLVLVPMLFLLPLGWVPLAVAAGMAVAAVLERPRDPAMLYVPLVNASYVLGPVAVLAAAGEAAPAWEDWPVYVGALAAQLAVDAAVSALRRGVFLGHLVDAALAPIGLALAFVAVDTPAAFLLVIPLLNLLAYFSREGKVRVDQALQLGHAYRGTALLLEADDLVTLVLKVADRLGVGPRERQQAEFVALLHDVGKVGIPDEIINKPGPLTADERAVIETHTVQGQRMLDTMGGMLGEVGKLVRSCRERWDGEGYPDGLVGEEIPLVSRIVCACGAFSAMTTDRPYRAAMPVGEAVAELRRCAGTQFDPRVVEAVAAVAGAEDIRRAA